MLTDIVILHDKYKESRGDIYTLYDSRDFDNSIKFVQDKISKSYKGVIRGFHGDRTTWKLITCLHGRIKLVTYDLYSSTKKEYILDGDDDLCQTVLIGPRTLNAHQALTDCIFYYKWSEYYTGPDDQISIYYNDPTINPYWENIPVIVSERDKNADLLENYKGII